MKIPVAIVCLGLSTLLAAQAWTLKEVVTLKVQLAELAIIVTHRSQNIGAESPSAFQSAENKHQNTSLP